MPGLLIMNHSGSDAAAGTRDAEGKKRSHEGKLINGDRMDVSSPGAVNGGPSKDANGAVVASASTASISNQLAELPPEIVEISKEAYNPLSTLLMRISQETFNQLNETLSSMAELPVSAQTNGVMSNGLPSHGQDNTETNKRKKLLLMKFAQDNRAKFIKLLVLTEWGKKAAYDVSKLINLFAWAREQQEHMDFVDAQIERIKLYTSAAGERNPDITTALEILSTGKAPWMPTLDYIAPDPIASDKALKLLRYMNTSLSIRLNVHETLPRRLRNWRIQSGRATFVIENELEFDVVSFVEDASDQWWFIDLRILFSPAPTITVGSQFFVHLKNQADFTLREKGLGGLYDFLHNFVLTHKITVLRSQALGLVRSQWTGSLKVEPVHRELVVQYWTDRPGKKNWIEIGVQNNKAKKGKESWRGPPIASLNVRWFRQGTEVRDAKLKFDWTDLSFEKVIKRVIALHTADILRQTQEHIQPQITVHTTSSNDEPADSRLQVVLGPTTNSTTLSLEPVTGQYILQPATALSAKAEFAFNQGREPKQIANVLTQLLAQTLRELVQKCAQQLGWHQVARQSLHVDVVRTAVKMNVLQYVLYSPRGWSSNWTLAALVDASGVSWWIFELAGNASAVQYAERIQMERPDGSTLSINRSSLASMERVAVQLLATRVTTRALEKEGKPFSLRFDFGQATGTEIKRVPRGWVLYLQTSDLVTTKSGEQPWLEQNLAIICQGLRPGGDQVWHIATGNMVKSIAADMQKLMAATPQSGFKISKDGSFRILLSTPFGQDLLGELRARLRDVNRLRSFASTLQKRKMRLGSSSLRSVNFQYGPTPHTAAVHFTSEKEMTVEMSHNNPHYRVLKLLTEITNERIPSFPSALLGGSNGLDRFCTTLVLTRSVLTALKSIETQTSNTNLRNPAVHVHSIFKYRITYENPVCSFDVRAQPKDDHVYWFIEDTFKNHSLDMRPSPERNPGHRRLENLQAKLKELFSGKGSRWFGTRNGLVAELDGVPDALKKLNEVVLSCKMEGGYKAPPPLETPAPAAQGQPGNQAQVNGQHASQQARAQQARQQQHAQQQAQARKQQQQQQANNQRVQMANGRMQQGQQQQQQQGQHGNMQMKQGVRQGQGQAQGGNKHSKDIIEID